MQMLAYGIRRTLEPIRIGHRLLGGEHFDESSRKGIEPVAVDDVMVQRRGVELRENKNLVQPGVETIADRNIDQPILAAERNCGLRSILRQRKQAFSGASGEDDR